MMPIIKSSDDPEASNAGSGTWAGSETVVEPATGAGAGTTAGSQRRIVTKRSLNGTADATIKIPDQSDNPDEGAPLPENELTMFVTIMAILEMAASGLGKLEIVWVMLMLQGGFAFTLQMKDFVFVTVILLFGGIRIFYASPEHNIQQLLTLFYWFQLVSPMTAGVLSAMQLYSQNFGPTQEAYKANRDFALNFFYVVALAEALMLLADKAIWEWKVKK